MWLGWGKPEFGVVDPHNSQMCTLFRCSPFLRGVERRAPEHHSTPQRSSKHSGMPPKPYPPHSDPQTLVPVAEYNYLGEVVVFSERWWGADPQRAIADPRQLQTTQVTPPLMPQHMFASDMLFAEMQLPVGSCIFRIPARRSFCSVIRCAHCKPLPMFAIVCPHPPHAVGTGCKACRS